MGRETRGIKTCPVPFNWSMSGFEMWRANTPGLLGENEAPAQVQDFIPSLGMDPFMAFHLDVGPSCLAVKSSACDRSSLGSCRNWE